MLPGWVVVENTKDLTCGEVQSVKMSDGEAFRLPQVGEGIHRRGRRHVLPLRHSDEARIAIDVV